MRFDKFTIKAQEVIQESQNIAEKYDHQQLEPEHILMALILQQEGTVPAILQKLGVDIPVILKQVEEALNKIPKVYGTGGGQPYISPRSKKVLDQA
ncbi:MAG: type VI secretion system ATPase TssH, partial [Deltaproteobacteria bacterium]|nr:type VI secretion system ATPase TssH [Deltaproteobacteria bacterium]